MTIQTVGRDLKVPVNEFDGKVIYGEKRGAEGEVAAELVLHK